MDRREKRLFKTIWTIHVHWPSFQAEDTCSSPIGVSHNTLSDAFWMDLVGKQLSIRSWAFQLAFAWTLGIFDQPFNLKPQKPTQNDNFYIKNLCQFRFFSTRLLFWADALEDRIESCDFEGRKRRQLIEHTAHPFGVTVFESNLYWTNWYNKSILKGHRRGRYKAQEFRTSLSGALEIRSVSRSRQPSQWSPCAENNGGCSHLCLYRFHTYRCECPEEPGTDCSTGNLI